MHTFVRKSMAQEVRSDGVYMTASIAAKKTSPKDWHPAEVVAAIRVKGWSLRQLALINGYTNPNSLAVALRRPWPKAEALIAETIGEKPETIWPTRYDRHGKPNRGTSGPRVMRPDNAKPSRLYRCRRGKSGAA